VCSHWLQWFSQGLSIPSSPWLQQKITSIPATICPELSHNHWFNLPNIDMASLTSTTSTYTSTPFATCSLSLPASPSSPRPQLQLPDPFPFPHLPLHYTLRLYPRLLMLLQCLCLPPSPHHLLLLPILILNIFFVILGDYQSWISLASYTIINPTGVFWYWLGGFSQWSLISRWILSVCWNITWSACVFFFMNSVSIFAPPITWCDNISVADLASNPVFHALTKLIEIDAHFICDQNCYTQVKEGYKNELGPHPNERNPENRIAKLKRIESHYLYQQGALSFSVAQS